MEKFTEYSKTLNAARKIHEQVFGPAKSHEEWAESFNKISNINEIIINEIKQHEPIQK